MTGQRTADRVAHDQAEEQPIEDTVEPASDERKTGEEDRVHQVGIEDEFLDEPWFEALIEDEDSSDDDVEEEVDDEEAFDRLLGDGVVGGNVFEPPAGEIKAVNDNDPLEISGNTERIRHIEATSSSSLSSVITRSCGRNYALLKPRAALQCRSLFYRAR